MILVASTVAAHACDGKTEFNWLTHRTKWASRNYGYFLSAQLGQGHDEKVQPLIDKVLDIGGTVWRYSLDQGEESVSTDNRLPAIATGRNLAHEYVSFHPAITHVQWIDTDVTPTADGIERLLEVDHPIVGAYVPAYCHDGPRLETHDDGHGWVVEWKAGQYRHPASGEVIGFPAGSIEEYNGATEDELHLRQRHWSKAPFPPGADVRKHWTTAGGLLMQRSVIKKMRWRSDKEEDGLSEDPAFQRDAVDEFGETWVRHDVVWSHQSLVGLEMRGRDLSVIR